MGRSVNCRECPYVVIGPIQCEVDSLAPVPRLCLNASPGSVRGGVMRVLGLCITFLSIPSAVFLYRTLRFGRFMHFVPYVLMLVGTAIAVAADSAQVSPWCRPAPSTVSRFQIREDVNGSSARTLQSLDAASPAAPDPSPSTPAMALGSGVFRKRVAASGRAKSEPWCALN